MNIYLTSDTHFDHFNIIKYANRPFSCAKEMNEVLIQKWNELIDYNDHVYHLGDFCLSKDPKRWAQFIHRLNGKIHLIRGNHDYNKPVNNIMNEHGIPEKLIWIKDYHKLVIQDVIYKKNIICLMHYAMRIWDKSHHGSMSCHGHCFSSDTEILTREGYKGYREITGKDEVLTLNLKSNYLEYQKIQEIFVYPNTEKIIEIQTKSGNILVTPKHKMIHKTICGFREIEAIDLLKRSTFIMPVTGNFEGMQYPFCLDFCKLLGFIISEGHFHKTEHKYASNGISIHQNPKDAWYIKQTLDNLSVDYTTQNKLIRDKFNTRFYIKAYWVKEYIYPWLVEKNISDKLMNLNGKQFRAFLAGLIFGDGSLISKKKNNKIDMCEELINGYPKEILFTYHTKNKDLKDRLSHLCTLNGMHPYSRFRNNHGWGNGAWYINISKRKHIHIVKSNRKIIRDYKDTTWCVQVPNHTLIARRNGFTFITGNSHGKLPEDPISRSMDVGVDTNNYYPYHYEEVRDKLLKKVGYVLKKKGTK